MTDQVTISRELLERLRDAADDAHQRSSKFTRPEIYERLLLEADAALAAPAQDGWIPVSERLPEGTVLAYYTNSHGKGRRIRARYVNRFTQESEDIDNFDAQYNEDDDTYYDAEGWYELIDNWGDYSSVAVVEGEITHWCELPPPPKESK
jgi:hypothetical protein